MRSQIYTNTVSTLLLETLQFLMNEKIFNTFRLVGGTALSLQLGHRQSIDIDLFTDLPYGAVDFIEIDYMLHDNFEYVDSLTLTQVGMGKSFFIGKAKDSCIKLDVFYTEPFIKPAVNMNELRLSHLDDLVAMKMDVITRGGRKKDFWDIHELLRKYSLNEMLLLHQKRYPYVHERKESIKKLTDFEFADKDFDPICSKNKHWEIIKLDLFEATESI